MPTGENSRRLLEFAASIEADLGHHATVSRTTTPARGVDIHPGNPRALGIGWVELGREVVLSVQGSHGGRWELAMSGADLDLLEAIVGSVIEGRVQEVRAVGRSRVTVVLADGRRLRETGGVTPSGCLPLPLWTRWGRRTMYEAYRP